jgi:hypothetical protein
MDTGYPTGLVSLRQADPLSAKIAFRHIGPCQSCSVPACARGGLPNPRMGEGLPTEPRICTSHSLCAAKPATVLTFQPSNVPSINSWLS